MVEHEGLKGSSEGDFAAFSHLQPCRVAGECCCVATVAAVPRRITQDQLTDKSADAHIIYIEVRMHTSVSENAVEL